MESNNYYFNCNFLFLGLASDLWSMLTFTKKNTNDSVLNDHNDFYEAPLATQSLLLILILVHHWTTQSNPYRTSLFSCLDSQGSVQLIHKVYNVSVVLSQFISKQKQYNFFNHKVSAI